MADPDQRPDAVPVTEIAEPHRSAVDAILHAVLRGVFSADEADLLIERIRAHGITSASSIMDGLVSQADGADPAANSPHRTSPSPRTRS